VGLLIGTILACEKVLNKELGIGDFVLFITYMQQLYEPLNYFGTYYRMIIKSFVDMESMFQLLSEEPEVEDAINAIDLNEKGSPEISFNNVSFYYSKEDRIVLKNISFVIPPCSKIAIVGPSGGGKSTLLK
jgi:ATP-binding cassette subfamily B (MDR/TAP) protein 6